jgi:FKBP-type peptidyl-prolyl cis-trans isomerase SlyD
MKISDGTFVSLSYQLNVGTEEEMELMEEATTDQPFTFIFGMGTMLPAFEKKIAGLEKGAKFSFCLQPEEAYGEYNEEYILELNKSIFKVDGKIDEEEIFEGNTLPMMDSNGNRMFGSILEVQEDSVLMDFNHPLAGEILTFDGTVLDVHVASPEEIAAMAADCSGGCDCGDDCDCGDEKSCNCGH